MRIIFENEELLILDKPSGLLSHDDGRNSVNLLSVAEKMKGQKLWLAHRLDQETSGVIALAKSKAKSEELRQIFEKNQVQKCYRFLTENSENERNPQSPSRNGAELVCEDPVPTPQGDKSARTRFVRIKRSPFYESWYAFPETGRTHQIRFHAMKLGIPILGDQRYQGASFPRICLHAEQLTLPGFETFNSRPPLYFDRLGYLKDTDWCQLLSALDFRLRGLGENCLNQTFRVFYSDLFTIEWLQDRLWVQWRSPDLTLLKKLTPALTQMARYLKVPLLFESSLFTMEQKKELGWLEEKELFWIAGENNLVFELRSQQGFHHGLFLDHRPQRELLQHLSSNKRVLNLFCYTGSLGVAAAKGGCKSLDQVDLSKPYLEWAKKNLILNGFLGQVEKGEFKFFNRDSMEFLDQALKKNLSWDLILIDPPTFSRKKTKSKSSQIFRVQKEGLQALQVAWKLLAPKGRMLFSTNDQTWLNGALLKDLKNSLPRNAEFLIGEQPLDFTGDPTASKSFWILKNH